MTNATEVVSRALAGKARRFSAIVVCDGNSLTAGQGSTGGQTYPAQLAAEIPDCLVVNVGIGAQNTISMISNSGDVDAYLTSIKPPRIVIAWELRNDIHALGATPAEAVDHMEAYCLGRRTLGAKIVVMNTTPSNGVSDTFSDEEQVAVNAELLARWPDFADAHVDLAGRPNLADPDNGTYYDADKIHITNAGYTEVMTGALAFVSSRSARALL